MTLQLSLVEQVALNQAITHYQDELCERCDNGDVTEQDSLAYMALLRVLRKIQLRLTSAVAS